LELVVPPGGLEGDRLEVGSSCEVPPVMYSRQAYSSEAKRLTSFFVRSGGADQWFR
jgi:hypothetical protein